MMYYEFLTAAALLVRDILCDITTAISMCFYLEKGGIPYKVYAFHKYVWNVFLII